MDGAEAPALSAAPAVTEDGAEAPSASPVVTEDGAEDEAPSAAPAATDEGAEDQPRHGDSVSEEQPHASAEDHADRVGVYCCQDCGEAFTEEASYSEHRHQHLQEKVILDEQFGFQNAEKDTAKNNFCTVCKTSFVDLSEFHSHMEQKHGVTSQDESHVQLKSETATHPKYECPECGRCYGMYGHFLNHVRAHTQASKSLFCDLEHLKKKSFQCESCGRSYSRASALDAHRRCHEEKLVKSKNRSSGDLFHTEEEPAVEAKPAEKQTDSTPGKLFNCSCGREFTALMGLKTHQRFCPNNPCTPELTVVKPKKIGGGHRCSECGKTYSSHIALINHERWHSKIANDPDRKYSCEACGKVFVSLTFYEKHQHRVHNAEAPAKSFLHQVCQLQKKAFECNKCGLKFSRASALQSHLIHHTENFQETLGVVRNPRRENTLDSERNDNKGKDTETMEIGLEQMETNSIFPARIPDSSIEHVVLANETDEDAEIYKPEDLIVQVISGSESEEELAQEPNPDLELLCESDQEQKDDYATGADSSRTFPKSEMDLNIVQIDYEQADAHGVPVERDNEVCTTQDRYDCPDCYRWFTSAVSLRVHRNWHNVRTRRQQTQGQSEPAHTCDTVGHEASSFTAHCSHIQQHMNQNTNNDAVSETEGTEPRNLTCKECGKCFSRLSALVSHQLHHPKRKQFQCPNCMMSYSYAASLFNHMKNCSVRKREDMPASKKEYNPKKTLLGPKIYHCEQCGKGFWSLGAYSHHKQNPTQCVDLMLRKGVSGSLHSVNRHSRSSVKVACPVCGRKFRHKGIMALHMRKHENGNHKCDLCNRSFRLFSSLLRHQVVHNDQLPPPIKSFQHQVEQLKKNTYSCPDCGKLFSRAKALQFHMKSHGYETAHSPSSPRSSIAREDLQCLSCLAHFNSKASLRAHQKLCVKRESQGVDCKVEPAENDALNLISSSSMEVSTLESSENITVKSEDQKRENETDDLKISKTNLKYKCKKCDRSFSVIGALNLHKRIHVESHKAVVKAKLAMSVIKKFKQDDSSKGVFHCSDCGRRFMSNSALGSHRRWHKEKKLSQPSLNDDDFKSCGQKTEGGHFLCNKCGKQFFNHCVLQRHQLFNPQCQTKTELEPDASRSVKSSSTANDSELSCPDCVQTFVQHSLLVAHIEKEHGKTREEWLTVDEEVPEKVDRNLIRSESVPTTPKLKVHQCALCLMTFAKARGLRAHRWQVHSNTRQSKKRIILTIKKNTASSREIQMSEENATSTEQNSPLCSKEEKIQSGSPVKSNSCLHSGKQSSPEGACLDQSKVRLGVKQEPKQGIKPPDTSADAPPSLPRLSEHTVKCLFKCDKCGKAFQTEELLRSHKSKAKSRPYCCALCCQGFWVENQLQQHLAWHDEVRCRLPNEVRFRLSAALNSKPPKPIIPSADTKKKPISCSSMKSDSLSQKSHKCQHCGKAFLSPSALQKHETQHCNDSYHCSICPRTFSEIQDLIDHHQECIGVLQKAE